jgi:hypothetical protein
MVYIHIALMKQSCKDDMGSRPFFETKSVTDGKQQTFSSLTFYAHAQCMHQFLTRMLRMV